jgi:calcineurin B family protein 1
MGNSSDLLQRSEIEVITKETGFSSGQVKRLYARFNSLDKDKTGYLTKNTLVQIPELRVSPLRDRIIEVLISDYGTDGRLNFRQFANVLATFRRKNSPSDDIGPHTRENKPRFVFNVYDRDKDERISKDELLSILSLLVGANLPEEQMNAIAERTIAELDENGATTGITYEDFCKTLAKIDIENKMSMKFVS